MRKLILALLILNLYIIPLEAKNSFLSNCGYALWSWWNKGALGEAKLSLENRFSRNFEELGQDGIFLLGRVINNDFKWALLKDKIKEARVIDLSFNSQLSSQQIIELLMQNKDSLESLNLRGVRINRELIKVISQLPKLKKLILENLPYFSIKYFYNHPTLIYLDLSQTKIWKSTLRKFLYFPPKKLKQLILPNWSFSCIRNFQRLMESKEYPVKISVRSAQRQILGILTMEQVKNAVIDGDTLKLDIPEFGTLHGLAKNIRLRDIQAAETLGKSKSEDERFVAEWTRNFLMNFLVGKNLELTHLENYKYKGEYVAEVWADNISISSLLLDLGVVFYYPFEQDSRKPTPNWTSIRTHIETL